MPTGSPCSPNYTSNAVLPQPNPPAHIAHVKKAHPNASPINSLPPQLVLYSSLYCFADQYKWFDLIWFEQHYESYKFIYKCRTGFRKVRKGEPAGASTSWNYIVMKSSLSIRLRKSIRWLRLKYTHRVLSNPRSDYGDIAYEKMFPRYIQPIKIPIN